MAISYKLSFYFKIGAFVELVFENFLDNPLQFQRFPIVLFTSKDEFDLTQAIAAIGKTGFSLEKITEAQIAEELVDSLFTHGDRLFWIDGCDGIGKSHIKNLEDYVANRSSCAVVITGSASPELCSFAHKVGLVVKAQSVKPWELLPKVEKWIVSYLATYFETHAIACDPRAASYLSREFAGNRSLIKQELDKLALYCLDRKVTLQDVLQLVVATSKKPLYELHDAFLRKDRRQMVMLLASLRDDGVHPLQITRYLRNQIHQDLLREGQHPKRQQLVEQVGEKFLLTSLIAIDAVEVQLKNQTQDESLTLERALIGL